MQIDVVLKKQDRTCPKRNVCCNTEGGEGSEASWGVQGDGMMGNVKVVFLLFSMGDNQPLEVDKTIGWLLPVCPNQPAFTLVHS